MSRVNILHVIETLGPGGAERVLLNNLRHLNKDKFNNIVVYLYDEDHFLSDLIDLQIKVYSLHIKNIYQPVKVIRELIKIIKREHIDIVHTHLFAANLYGRIAGKISGVPYILSTLHNPDYKYYSEFRNRFFFETRKFLDKFSGRLSNNYFIAVSEAVKEHEEKYLGFRKTIIIPNSIDVDYFRPLSEDEREIARKNLDLTKEDIVLVTVARLALQKGFTYLLGALDSRRLRDKKIKLIIVGKGPLEAKLKDKARTLGLQDNVIFLGTRKGVRDIVGSSDMFIFPSIYEGFGIALLEAMAMKIPCIATNIDGIKEIITDDNNGVLVKASSSIALSDAISSLIDNPSKRTRIKEAGYIKVQRDFNITQQIGRLEDIYSSFDAKRNVCMK